MQSASEAAVTSAINLLLEDITFQNKDGNIACPGLASDNGIEFSALDCQIETLLEALRGVETQVQSRVSQLRRHRNTLSPIHRLPFELLAEIFGIAADETVPLSGYYQTLGRLSGVCALWGTIIDQAPQLWAVVFPHYDPRLIDKIVDTSGNRPLSVLSKGYHHRRDMGLFLKRLRPTFHRLKAAAFILLDKESNCFQEYLQDASAPRLKRLNLADLQDKGAPIDLFRGGADRLEELNLSGVSVPWTSSLLSHLRILRLKSLYAAAGVTTSHLFTALMQCPDLSELRIESCQIDESGTPDHLPARLVLPHLNVLELHHIYPPSAAYSLLSYIHSPKYKTFHLISAFAREPPNEDEAPFQLQVTRPFVMDVFGWITDAFADALEDAIVKVVIGPDHIMSQEDVATLCSKVPTITALRIFGTQTPLIRYLATPTLVDGIRRWPLPQLVSLTVQEGDVDPDEMLGMLESRYGYTLKNEDAKARLPSPFSTLVIRSSGESLDDRTLQEIRRIVGEDCLEHTVLDDIQDDADSIFSDVY